MVEEDGLKLLDDLNLVIQPCVGQNITTSDGTSTDIQGVVDLPVTVDDCCRVIKAYVVPTITHRFIFGVDFAKEFDIVVDFSKNNWHVKPKSLPVSSFSLLPKPNTKSNNHCYSIDDLSPDRKLALEVVNSFKDIDSGTRRGRTNKLFILTS